MTLGETSSYGGYTRSVTRAVCETAEARFDPGYLPHEEVETFYGVVA